MQRAKIESRFDGIEYLYNAGISVADEVATSKEQRDLIAGETIEALLALGVTEDEIDEVLEYGAV